MLGKTHILGALSLFSTVFINQAGSVSTSYGEIFHSFFRNNPFYKGSFKKDSKYLFVGSFYYVHNHALVEHIPTIRVVGKEEVARATAASMIDEVLTLNQPKYKAILSARKVLLDLDYCPLTFLEARKESSSTIELWYLLPSDSDGAVTVQHVSL
jgi:hypothetical protein